MHNDAPGSTAANSSKKVAWTVEEWKAATSLGHTTVFALLRAGDLASCTVGKRRLILTAPIDFLRSRSRGVAA